MGEAQLAEQSGCPRAGWVNSHDAPHGAIFLGSLVLNSRVAWVTKLVLLCSLGSPASAFREIRELRIAAAVLSGVSDCVQQKSSDSQGCSTVSVFTLLSFSISFLSSHSMPKPWSRHRGNAGRPAPRERPSKFPEPGLFLTVLYL